MENFEETFLVTGGSCTANDIHARLCVIVQVVKGTIRDTRQKVTGLVENNEYQYRVCAVNKAGAGNYSEASELYKAHDPIGIHLHPL